MCARTRFHIHVHSMSHLPSELLQRKRRTLAERKLPAYETAITALGNHYANAGKHREALAVYTEAAGVFAGQPTCRMQLGRAHRMAGEMHMLLEDFAAAGTNVDKFLRKKHYCVCNAFVLTVHCFRTGIAQQEKNAVEEQRAYATIGRLHLLHGQSLNVAGNATDAAAQSAAVLRRAEAAFQRSLAVCKRLPDGAGVNRLERIDMQARLYLNLGVTRECLGDLDDTELNMERALQLCRDHNLYELLHQCYVTTASFVFHKRSDTTKALRLLSLALAVAGERLDKRRKCETLIAKADIFIRSADFQSARQTLHQAYRLHTPVATDRRLVEQQLRTVVAISRAEDQLVTTSSTDHVTRRTLFERLGDGACQLRNFTKALDYYAMMLASAEKCFVSERELVPIYVSLYQTYIDLGRYDEALVYLRKEYDLVKDAPSEAIATLMNIADALGSSGQDFWTIDTVLQQARGHAAQLADRKLETRILQRMVRLRTRHKMLTLVEVLRDEATAAGIILPIGGNDDSEDDDDDDDSSAEATQKNTLDIGDDIDLAELSGLDDDDDDHNGAKSTTDDRVDTATGRSTNDPIGQVRRPVRKKAAGGIIKRNEKGETALHQACIAGNVVQVRRLLDQSHPVNVRDFAGWMPLHEAANHDHVEVVRLLLERGAWINDKGGKMCDGVTALHDACGNGCLEVANVLLDAGANATMRTDLCETPVDTLEKWRRTQDKLDDVDQSLYTHVRARLLQQMERTGVTRSAVLETPPRTSGTQGRKVTQRSSSDRRTQQSVRRRQRRSSSVSSSDSGSDVVGAPSTVSARQTIDNILADEFATQQPTHPVSDSDHEDDGPRDDDDLSRSAMQFGQEHDSNASAGDACSDYRSVMAALRKSSTATTPLQRHASVDEGRMAKRRAGILDDQEVGENWLEDDIATSVPKKAKLLSLGSTLTSCSAPKTRFIPREQRRSKENNQPNRWSGLSGSSSSVFNGFSGTSSATDEASLDAFDVLMNPASNKVSSSTVRPRRPSTTGTKPAAGASGVGQRNSLLHAGFVQFKTAAHDGDADENVVSSTRMEYDAAALPAVRAAPVIPKIVAGTTFKVRVNEQLLNVPVNNEMIADLTIGWLAEETSRRYYK